MSSRSAIKSSQDQFLFIFSPLNRSYFPAFCMPCDFCCCWKLDVWNSQCGTLEISFSPYPRVCCFLFLIFLTFIYFWETERGRVWAGEGQRERETQNSKQAAGSELSAQSPTWGPNSQIVRSWPEPKSDTQPTEPRRRPKKCFLKVDFRVPGGSVSWVSYSWFWLRSWSHSSWVRASRGALCWQCGACLEFSLSPSLSALPPLALSLPQNK